MKILITGANGMVGKNLVEILTEQDCKILTPTSSQLDLRNLDCVDKYMGINKPDLIVHLASVVGSIQEKILNPFTYLSENISIDNNVINAAYKNNIRKVINVSSLLAYPHQNTKPLSEELITKKGEVCFHKNPYAISKSLSIKLCSLLHYQNNMFRYISLIPCSIYGCYDNYDSEKSHFIAAAINKIHRNKSGAVRIWGDGMVYREVIFAEDFAKIIWGVIQKYEELPSCINVGSGVFKSITEYYIAIGKVLGYKGRFEFDHGKPSGDTINILDTTILSNHIPLKFTNFDEGIKLAYQEFITRS
jgi:GDP-L-fucose synthase